MSSLSSGDEVVLGLDAGTTSAKAVAVDGSGRVRATAASDPIATRSTAEGGSEQDPDEIWQALVAAGRQAVEVMGCDTRVAALAVAAQSGSVIPVSAGGFAERAITWMDTRPRSVVESWTPEVSDRIRAISGWAPSPGVGLSTIAWLHATRSDAGSAEDTMAAVAAGAGHPGPAGGSEPDRKGGPASVDRWASVDDYLVFRLTGRWATNPSNAAGMQMMEITTCTWSPELCRVAGVDPSEMSPIHPSGTLIGELTAAAAASLGVDAGTPVVMGGHDQACAALGLGAVDPGHVLLSAGTAWVLTLVTDRADVAILPPGLNLSPHVVAGRWTASQNLGGRGAILADTPVSAMPGAFRTGARAVRQALEGAGGLAVGCEALVMVGGGTRFGELVEMVADVVDRPVVARPDSSWPAIGAARLAAAALGWAPP